MSGRLVVAGLSALALATGCSSAATSPRASARVTSTASPGAAAGPCASVKTTTPITDVPQACAELWAPYQVTEVPPPDILQQEHVPPAPKVVNRTNGAVSDAEAQRWADASNRESGWYRWAEATSQPTLLIHLLAAQITPASEADALSQGAHIEQPDCDLFPTAVSLFPIGSEGQRYFGTLSSDDRYVLVAKFSGPCAYKTVWPDGHTTTTAVSGASPPPIFIPGSLRSDQLLGALWFSDGGGNCSDPAGPPRDWCSR